MHAVISGRAGRALVLDGESLTSFDVDDASNCVRRWPSDLPYLFGESRDLRVIENSDIESISRELKADAYLNLALDLILISLDEELEEHIRKDALYDLDEILTDNQLVVQLENILYARPLPDDADLARAVNLCFNRNVPNILALLGRFERWQPLINDVSAAWDAIPTKLFGSYEDQAEFQRVAIREGLFRSLVVPGTSPSPVVTFFMDTTPNYSLEHLHNWRNVVRQWGKLFITILLEPKVKTEVEEEGSLHERRAENLAYFRRNDHLLLIMRAFDDPSAEVRNAAARALFDFQLDRVTAHTEALRAATPERRRKIGSAIASSGLANEAIRNLTGERAYDAFSLLFLMSKAGAVRPLMRAIEGDPDINVRLAVIELLAVSGQPDILPAFRRMAVRGSLPPEVRSALMEAVYRISRQEGESTSSVA